jgi:histidine triad (HIT) family protein
MMDVLQRAAAVVTGQCGACRVVSNMGRYQDSKHLHWHVISGKAGDPAIPIGQN